MSVACLLTVYICEHLFIYNCTSHRFKMAWECTHTQRETYILLGAGLMAAYVACKCQLQILIVGHADKGLPTAIVVPHTYVWCVLCVDSTWGKWAFAPEGATERKQAVKQRAPWKVCYALSSPRTRTLLSRQLSHCMCVCGRGRGLDCVKTHLHCLSATLTVYLQIVSSRRQLCAKLKWN